MTDEESDAEMIAAVVKKQRSEILELLNRAAEQRRPAGEELERYIRAVLADSARLHNQLMGSAPVVEVRDTPQDTSYECEDTPNEKRNSPD